MKKICVLLSLVLVLGIFAGCAKKPGEEMSSQVVSESSSKDYSSLQIASHTELPDESLGFAEDFSITGILGETIDMDYLAQADLTMVNIWATFCGPCIQEMPELGELEAQLKEQGVQIIGLLSDGYKRDGSLSDEKIDLAKEIIEKTQANYPHILPEAQFLKIRLANISVVPTTFFVDKNGQMVGDLWKGRKDKEGWVKVIQQTLDGMGIEKTITLDTEG